MKEETYHDAGNSSVTGEFPAQRPVTRSSDVFFELCLNKRLSKQSWDWWFETPSCSLWRHRNVVWHMGTALSSLTYLPLAPHICVSERGHHWFGQWLVTCTASSHYLNHCWNIINWPIRNKLQWNLIGFHTFPFKKMHLKMASAKWRPFCLGLNVLNGRLQYTSLILAVFFLIICGQVAAWMRKINSLVNGNNTWHLSILCEHQWLCPRCLWRMGYQLQVVG